MPSTDIDGSVIVMLSKEEARRVYDHFLCIAADWPLDDLDKQIAGKIARDLNLNPIE